MRSHVAVALCALLAVAVGLGCLSFPAYAFADEAAWSDMDALYTADVTEDGLFEVSSKDNIIVFVLDTFDTRDLARLEDEGRGILDGFTGFTWYRNVTGAMMPTRFAIPFLLTGELPREDDDWNTYLKERYSRSTFIEDLFDAGYDVGIYVEDAMLELADPAVVRDRIARKTVNVHRRDLNGFRSQMRERAAFCLGLHPVVPSALDPRFWFDTAWIDASPEPGDEEALESKLYECDDAAFYERLQRDGLTVRNRGARGSVRFIHLEGVHDPYSLTADGERVADGASTFDNQAEGSMRIVQCYLDKLKDLGLYDTATVIVTADHGEWLVRDTLHRSSEPVLLYKPYQWHVDAAADAFVSDAEVEHGDILPTIAKSAGADPARYGGMPLDERDPDAHGARYFLATVMSGDMTRDEKFVQWEIDGHVLDFGNWSKTGHEWYATD